MLPGKAEKRVASSVFITLVPPRREVATKEPTPRETGPVGAEVPATRGPRTPPVPNGGEGCVVGGLRAGCVCSPSPGSYRCCLSPLAGTAFAFGAGQSALLQSCRGVIATGCHGTLWPPTNPPHPAFTAETHPAAPVPSSPPVFLLSDAPQPLSAEALSPALQQLDLAAPTTLQVRTVGCNPPCPPPPSASVSPPVRRVGSSLVGETEAGSNFSPPDICAFCHKALGPREPTVEAMRKQYHADCFTCRTCHRRLAGQRYYQRDGRPTCDACYQVPVLPRGTTGTLGRCHHRMAWVGRDHKDQSVPGGISRHVCVCKCAKCQGTFAVDEQDEVFCVDDFYRKYAAVCGACEQPIVPRGDKDTYKIECLGRSFHEGCYRCESCRTPLSPEPTEKGCYPLGDHLLCKSCHVRRRNESSC
uniref:Filamin binding LIM protein 1 n=1 Tax=Calidris pygmaea TaxID=425635 RepID=A0A8C3J021_9CHAR